VKVSGKVGDLVQPGKAPAENAPPLPLTEEHGSQIVTLYD
jgi:hypothetical protein